MANYEQCRIILPTYMMVRSLIHAFLCAAQREKSTQNQESVLFADIAAPHKIVSQ